LDEPDRIEICGTLCALELVFRWVKQQRQSEMSASCAIESQDVVEGMGFAALMLLPGGLSQAAQFLGVALQGMLPGGFVAQCV
jgi:hypothetical protein